MAFDEAYQPIDIDFEVPQRCYHLSGGLVLLQGSNRVCWLCSRHSKDAILFSYLENILPKTVPGYREIRVLGCTTFNRAEEMHEMVTDNFVLRDCSATNNCLAFDQHTYWSGVAHNFSMQGMAGNFLLAGRISTQIIKATRRLERLSIVYRSALMATNAPEANSKSFSQNKYASNIGNEFGSLLDDLYALRDAINSLICRMHFGMDRFSTPTMRRRLKTEGKGDLFDLIRYSMFDDVNGDLIIYRMSLYRGIAIHCLGTSNPIVRDSIFTNVEDGPLGPLVKLVYPLYEDLSRLESIEKGEPCHVSEDDFMRYAQQEKYLDALEFGYDSFIRLLRICELAQQKLGLQASTHTIKEKDILKAEFTDADGRKRRYERNNETGKLEEIVD